MSCFESNFCVSGFIPMLLLKLIPCDFYVEISSGLAEAIA
jgi:hypothetical protein